MTRYLVLGILAVAAMFPFQSRAGCLATDEAGFLHASAQRFPANIKGVLFQVPASWPLAEQDFDISSPDAVGALRPQISAVNLPPDSAARRELPRGTQLVRVNILGGFRPGTSYTVRYTGRHRWSMHYPSSMTFAVDTDAVDLDAADFKLLVDPIAVGRLLQIWDEDTALALPAAARGVTLQLPPALAMYRQAISVFHEQTGSEGLRSTRRFHALYNTADACTGRDFGAPFADEPDVVYRRCGPALEPTAVRASAAFLEIDDRLVVTGTQTVDWGQDMDAACTPAGRVRITLEAGETLFAWRAMCDESKGPAQPSIPDDLRYRYAPTAGQFAELAQLNASAHICTARFMGGLLAQGRTAPADLIEVFVRLVDETLAADDKRFKHQLLQRLPAWIRTDRAEGQESALGGATLHPLVPRLRLLAQDPEFAAEATTVLGRIAP